MVNVELSDKLVVMAAVEQERYWATIEGTDGGGGRRDEFERFCLETLPTMPRGLALSANGAAMLAKKEAEAIGAGSTGSTGSMGSTALERAVAEGRVDSGVDSGVHDSEVTQLINLGFEPKLRCVGRGRGRGLGRGRGRA